jgi:two-component system, sensor histidine kinase RegB
MAKQGSWRLGGSVNKGPARGCKRGLDLLLRRMANEPESLVQRAGRMSQLGVVRGDRLRLRTLIMIRWVAAAGQTITVLAVHFGLGYPLPLPVCLAVVATLVLSNLILAQRGAGRARLDDRAGVVLLGFDVLQLAALLYVTGGLQNPFSILIIAPVMVSATILSRTSTVALTALSIVSISLLAFFRTPLPWSPGALELPTVYILGIWTALAVASVFISTYVWSVSEEARRMSEALAATQTSLLRQQRLTALGGLVAAAAHELGSPLATIAVVAKELSREVPRNSPIAEDVDLLLSQSERCREILAGLARTPEASGPEPFDRLPLRQLLESAAEPYQSDDIAMEFRTDPAADGDEPIVARSPEILGGLGTLMQNAVQFAGGQVTVISYWDDDAVRVTVHDDGAGFSPSVLSAIGEPFISTRSDDGEHMGLGIFIAQTLLERVGAHLTFNNRGGAEVVIRWPRVILDQGNDADGA